MKIRRYLFLVSFLVLSAATVILVSACKKFTHPLDNLQLIIDYNIIKTTTDIHVYDVSTGLLLNSTVSNDAFVMVSGRDEAAVVDPMGVKIPDNRLKLVKGITTLGLLPSAAYTPSATNMISFNLVVSAPGYLTTTQQVNISSVGKNFVNVNLVPLSSPPSGVTVGQQTGLTSAQNGTVTQSAQLVLPNDKASINIPSGILMRDNNGNPLSGDINVTVVHFDNTDPAAMQSFPGGLTPTVERANGNSESGMFYSAGFVAIEITDGQGRRASNFENGTVQLVSQVSPETYNPITQTSIVAGDQVPLWSLNENNGVWKEEGMAVAQLVDGNLQFDVQLTHLSYYNFDWFVGSMCAQGRPFVFNTNSPVNGSFLIKGHVYRQDDNTFINTILLWVKANEPVLTTFVPQGIPVKIFWDTQNSPFISLAPNEPQPTLIDNLCGSAPIPIQLFVNNNQGLTTINLSLSLFCASQPDAVIKPTYSAYCQNVNGGPVIPIEMIAGEASINGIRLGDTYYVWVIYDGQEYGAEVVVTQDAYSLIDFEIPADVCSEVFGM